MTESEEMYLVSIARLKETGEESPIPLSRLAADLDVLPVSANQMIRKLEECRLVTYAPYKGVDLTSQGEELALHILRHRRLWEVFLVERLGIAPEEAERLACRMEHILPEDAAERLTNFLGNPLINPKGLPIPATGNANIQSDLPLTVLRLDETGRITRIEADPAGRAFLLSEEICAGSQVRITAISGSGTILLQTTGEHSVYLSATLAKTIWVRKNPGQ